MIDSAAPDSFLSEPEPTCSTEILLIEAPETLNRTCSVCGATPADSAAPPNPKSEPVPIILRHHPLWSCISMPSVPSVTLPRRLCRMHPWNTRLSK